jgi:hypothetical protein
MLTQNQVNDIFQAQLGRNASPDEYSKLSGASLTSLGNLKSMGYSENPPTPITGTYDLTNPYTDPNVSAAAQNVANIGNKITAGNNILQQTPDIIQKDIAQTGGIVTNPQLEAEVKTAEAPITAQLRELGQQYSAAKSTYSATLSDAKQAIAQAKSQVSGAQSRALTQAGKVITLLQNGELDPHKVDLSQIEADAGLPQGFFMSITPKTTTAKSNIRSVQGGLYNVDTGKWIIPAKTTAPKTATTKTDKTALQTYLVNQGLPIALATNTGNLSSSMLNKVVSAGVPLSVAQGLWENMKAGNSFEEIRQGIKAQGGDPSILDKFVQTLQGGIILNKPVGYQ